MTATYNQTIKNQAREKLIKHAIDSLTIDRSKSFLVTKAHFEKITDHFNKLFFSAVPGSTFEFKNEYNWLFFGGKNSWLRFYDNHCKSKTADELKVLYLSGPEPYNDIDVLCNHGIRLENIWGIESDKRTYDAAVKSLSEARAHIKIHRGSLAEFFELTNHEFDIIYFDACTPIISGQQSPLEILKQIFLNKRLTGVSALITNFAEPKDNYNWGEILGSWFATKDSYESPPEDDSFPFIDLGKAAKFTDYSVHVNAHLESYYDAFLKYFIPTLASEIIPMWQLSSMSSVQSNYLLNEQVLKKQIAAIKGFQLDSGNQQEWLDLQHYLLAIDAYPLLNWARLVKENLSADHPLYRFITNTRNRATIEDSLYIGSLLKRFEEAGGGFNTFIYDICSDKLKETLTKLDFFDRDLRITCDIPMKNLLVELLIGLYGNPYVAHAEQTLSIKYKAKATWMYSNVFVFDQCRYLYDFLPTLDLWESFFENLPNQTIIRACIDEIRRNHLTLNSSFLKWGFIEGVHEDGFSYAKLPERLNLNSEDQS